MLDHERHVHSTYNIKRVFIHLWRLLKVRISQETLLVLPSWINRSLAV